MCIPLWYPLQCHLRNWLVPGSIYLCEKLLFAQLVSKPLQPSAKVHYRVHDSPRLVSCLTGWLQPHLHTAHSWDPSIPVFRSVFCIRSFLISTTWCARVAASKTVRTLPYFTQFCLSSNMDTFWRVLCILFFSIPLEFINNTTFITVNATANPKILDRIEGKTERHMYTDPSFEGSPYPSSWQFDRSINYWSSNILITV
jgi:hypothetical protein